MTIERQADPEGSNLKPVPPQETGRTLVFIGVFLVLCSFIAFMWVGADRFAGGVIMQTLFVVLFLGGLGLMLLGYSKRNKRN